VAAGTGIADVARQYGLSERQVRRITAAKPQPVGLDVSALPTRARLVEEVLESHAVALDTLKREAISGDNSGARVGAAGRLPGVALSLVDALVRLGLAAPDAGEWRNAHQTNVALNIVAGEMDRVGINGSEFADQMRAFRFMRFAMDEPIAGGVADAG